MREQLHLDQPALHRYFLWLGNVLQGDLGIALSSRRSIADILWPRITNTLILSVVAVLLYIPLALLPAVAQALNRNRPLDHAVSAVTLILASIPDFLLALLLLILFVVVLPLLPAVSIVTSSTDFLRMVQSIDSPCDHAGDRHGRLCGTNVARQFD